MAKQHYTIESFRDTPAGRLPSNAHIFGEKHSKEKKSKARKKEPKALTELKNVLDSLEIEYVEEHRFHEYRKFRFDLAILDRKVAIEYEGVMSKKSRHTTVNGYSVDADKYNLAQSMGWTVLRYTVINYKNFENDIKSLLNK
ncbi:hypothetical protein [Rhizosphaericola mali]|uniref:DUF559 domain-containing protein n=1 Tax=Rhizosphaericola mali TaxID=2545455 RepID=A0A5P2G4U6_9BACT|nr:hypothetical protein [Rhizosphaericola mali]QES88842.1 hypothetical protein E0W69_009310 [Rhizosphaericola mali]